MRQYKVYSKSTYWLYVAVMPCLFLGVGVFFLYLAVTKPASGPPLLLSVLWLAAVLYSFYRTALMPHTVELADDGLIRFTGPFRQTTVAPQDIVQIRGVSGQFLEVEYVGGKIRMLQQVTGLHEFLSELERVNPSVTFKGC